MSYPLLTVEIRFEQDVVLARQRARQIASLLGFDLQQQTQIATAVSEVVRSAFQCTGKIRVEFLVEGQSPQKFLTRVSDTKIQSNKLQALLKPNDNSTGDLGLGLVGAQRLMDEVQIQSLPNRGTIVELIERFPRHQSLVTNLQLAQLVEKLASMTQQDPFAEIQQQNQELLHTLEELRQRQEQLAQLNQELEDTNRGVVALYAELNDKAEFLQKASELKSRFLSHMSHEFRTPLNAILSLSRMLLGHLDGDLTPEQEKQVTFVHKSAESLSELVNDLLDIAKVEAGKVTVHPSSFTVEELFSGLRGTMRPLIAENSTVELIFEETKAMPTLKTDRGKVSQILRNFISNALKFTERGEIRIAARKETEQTIAFSVTDTGIGISSDNQKHIFEEFVQIENPLQHQFKGTGLGLSLSKKLAELLGGQIGVRSSLGVGSTFFVSLPIVYGDNNDEEQETLNSLESSHQNLAKEAVTPSKILLIDDNEIDRYTIKRLLANTPFQLIEAVNGYEGLEQARIEQPQVILLDLLMPDLSGFAVLEQLKRDPTTREIPVIIISSKQLITSESEQLANSTVAILSKDSQSQPQAIAQLQAALKKAGLNFEEK